MPKHARWTVVECRTPRELLTKLDPSSGWFEGYREQRSWVFRGQAEASWQLVPSAFRHKLRIPRIHTRNSEIIPEQRTNYWQAAFELDAVRTFFDFADEAGLPLPEDSLEFRQVFEDLSERAFRQRRWSTNWPPPQLWSLLAIAQHHGVPTRLLDWSWSPYVAAYFACVDIACQRRTGGDYVAVWAYAALGHDLIRGKRRTSGTVRIIRSPAGGNENLAAQKGVHLLAIGNRMSPDALVNTFALQTQLEDNHREWMRDDCEVLLQFVLRADQSNELLWRLSRLLVSGASLFPGYDGAAKAWNERKSWDRIVR